MVENHRKPICYVQKHSEYVILGKHFLLLQTDRNTFALKLDVCADK